MKLAGYRDQLLSLEFKFKFCIVSYKRVLVEIGNLKARDEFSDIDDWKKHLLEITERKTAGLLPTLAAICKMV